MKFRLRGRFTRRDLLGAARVALIATLLIAFSYAAVVSLLDLVVADHLTGQVDRQLQSRLQAAQSDPALAFSNAGVQTNGARYGLGIYGEPIALWSFSRSGELTKAAPGDPLLPAATRPPVGSQPTSLNYGIAGSTYRLQWLATRKGWLLAGESLSELGHVEAVLVTSEAVALPFLLLAFFLVALAIGLRSARPVETARRRQLEFTADASHELRTPLSVIEAETSLSLSQPRTVSEYEATLRRIAGESARLRAIVEDLLWLARLDSEPARPVPEATDLGQVAALAAERFRAVAAAKGQSIEIALDGAGGKLLVLAPGDWIEKMAATLTENACSYTPAGGRIRLVAAAEEGGRVAFRVEDDGPGIPDGVRSELVQRFRRASDQHGGHGLGLAIADSIAKGTGGRMRIGQSELGGALVEISWPRAASS